MARSEELHFADVRQRDSLVTDPVPGRLSVCSGGGCSELAIVGLEAAQWSSIRSLFEPPAADAAGERARLREAIARFERITGELAGTKVDRGGTFGNGGGPFQQDCVDESVNTTLYLRLIERQGLLRYYEVVDRASRGWFVFGWPHETAVIRDRKTGERWAVDSWFLDNGAPPFILPLDEWRRGWRPNEQERRP